MPPVTHVIYLHGFASSPQSSKAARFRQEAAHLGIGFSCPDFNLPSFEMVTVTRMLDQTREAIAAAGPGPVALVGSSLGGFVAVLVAAGADGAPPPPSVDRLILLSPALDFGGSRLRQLGEHGIDWWRARGSLRVFHHADGVHRDVGFALYEDAAHYDAWNVQAEMPILAFQGRHDESVDPAMVERWTSARPNVTLRLLDDGHQLTESVARIWKDSKQVLGFS